MSCRTDDTRKDEPSTTDEDSVKTDEEARAGGCCRSDEDILQNPESLDPLVPQTYEDDAAEDSINPSEENIDIEADEISDDRSSSKSKNYGTMSDENVESADGSNMTKEEIDEQLAELKNEAKRLMTDIEKADGEEGVDDLKQDIGGLMDMLKNAEEDASGKSESEDDSPGSMRRNICCFIVVLLILLISWWAYDKWFVAAGMISPTAAPTLSFKPTLKPTRHFEPTHYPSAMPSVSVAPSFKPTAKPSNKPTSNEPTGHPTYGPTNPTLSPTFGPTIPRYERTWNPTPGHDYTRPPTKQPSLSEY